MKIALVYDRVNKLGGAEKVLSALHQIWPDAPLFTSVYQPKSARWARSFTVITSFLNRLPFIRTRHELFAFLMPFAFESFNFDDYDVVISVTSAEAKGIITKPKTLHLCYLLTPTRYLWSHAHHYASTHYHINRWPIIKHLAQFLLSQLRIWDQIASQRPDQLIAISKAVYQRAEKFYRRQPSAIIYPPVEDFSQLTPADNLSLPDNYFLLVSRLVPYKNIDLAIKTCNQLKENLVIIGDGKHKDTLKQLAGPTIKFTGEVTLPQLVAAYRQSKALIFPSEEDFGIVSVEAQTVGKPVIAYAKGGAAETVIPGKTGVHFRHQTVESLARAIKRLQTQTFHPQVCKANARKYNQQAFKQLIIKFVDTAWQNHTQLSQ